MPRRRLLWHLYPLYLVITLAAFLVASEFASRTLRNFYYQHVTEDLTTRAVLAAALIDDHVPGDTPEQLEALCLDIGKKTSFRLTVIRTDGSVLADSQRDPGTMVNHKDRPEIREAMQGRIGRSERFSESVRDYLMYVAVPIMENGNIVAVVRTSMSLTTVDASLQSMKRSMALVGIAIALIVFCIIFAMLRRINRPIEDVKQGARRFASGELTFRMPVPDYEELGSLAETLNQMAAQLNDRINTIVRQRNEQQAVLASMAEGVIAVDTSECVLQVNRAAADLIGVHPNLVVGRSIAEVIRNTELQRLIARTLATSDAVEGEVTFYGSDERVLQVHATSLRDAGDKGIGALIVLNDITRLRRLERVRRDFVANVSHELKTPLTSIKGFVETLAEGAINEPQEAMRFLGIMAKQVDRLQAILEDLLSLSRIEQESERGEIALQDGNICDVLKSAIQLCARHAEAKNIFIAFQCDTDVRARINGPLLEQAAVNLIENAIKYSDPGKELCIDVSPRNGHWAIRFIDQGCGIEAEHLSRIFERFYRVDKARSRKEGGTGLGLAIVKHIVTAHGGRVLVTSTPGRGSEFTMLIPAS